MESTCAGGKVFLYFFWGKKENEKGISVEKCCDKVFFCEGLCVGGKGSRNEMIIIDFGRNLWEIHEL
jgi:hypothetical protein